MTAMTTTPIRAFAVWWKDFERWDVKFFSARIRSSYPVVRLGPLIHEHRERVKPFDYPETIFRILGVTNTGGIFHAYDSLGKEINQPYQRVDAADFAYNPYRVNVGSIGVVPAELGGNYISPAYVVFATDKAMLLPEYLILILKADWFNPMVRAATTGSVRQNLTFDLLATLEIPLPPLAEQKAIVAHWREAQDEISRANLKATTIADSLEAISLEKIGLKIEPPTPHRRAFAFSWSNLERWDTFFYRKDFIALKKSLSKLRCSTLGNLAHFISRPWSRAIFPEGSFQYVEISGVSKETGIVTSHEVATKDAPSRATTLLCEGDLIISTTRPYLGAFAIVPSKYANCVCSSGFALADSVDEHLVLKDYLLFVLKSPAGLKQMEQRMTGDLYPAITQDELEKIEIPLPPLAVQKQIMERVAAGREEIAREREAADRLARYINAEIEAMILGTKRVSNI